MINEPVLWLVKSASWLAAFTVIYFLFLRNERYFKLKRFYLVAGVIVSFIMPFISIHYKVVIPAVPVTEPFISQAGDALTYSIPAAEEKISPAFILMVLYLTGMLVVAARIFWHFIRLRRTISRSTRSEHGDAIIIKTEEYTSSFTFFNYVFINPAIDESELGEILNHEMVHVRQQHWFDLLLAETVRIVQWANPLAWVYTRFMKLNHEHLADQVALKQSPQPAFYKAALLNQMFRTPVISLSNPFNYSLNKNRFEMMKNIIWSPYRRLKVLLIVPVIAILVYAFAIPEVVYTSGSNTNAPEITESMVLASTMNPQPAISETVPQAVQDAGVKGRILTNEGTPLKGANISVTGIGLIVTTDAEGRFVLESVKPEAQLLIAGRGYKSQMIKPEFGKEMVIKMEVDTEYAARQAEQAAKSPLIIIDDVVTTKVIADLNEMSVNNEIGTTKTIPAKEAIEKYGEKAKNGAIEIMTRKRAAELGIQLPIRRSQPTDYPTFQGKSFPSFKEWVLAGLTIPQNSISQDTWVSMSFVVKGDGSIGNVTMAGTNYGEAGNILVNKIKSSPRWEPAANPEARTDFTTSMNVKITPNGISDDMEPFVVVEQMPMYPGGDAELLKFIGVNTTYPEAAKKNNIQGRVIVRFIVNTQGNTEDPTVLKGVDPLLDQEAIRVVSLLTGFQPGMQGGKAVPVWYMVPITFTLK